MKVIGSMLRIVIIVAVVLVFAYMLVPNMGSPSHYAKLSRASNDMRTIEKALLAYKADHGAYPTPAPSKGGWTVLPTMLTTPTAYLSHLPLDPFDQVGDGYGYALVGEDTEQWLGVPMGTEGEPEFVLLSPGPKMKRREFRLEREHIYDPANGVDEGYVYRFGGGEDAPKAPAEVKLTYDPTNGTRSGNGIYRVKQ